MRPADQSLERKADSSTPANQFRYDIVVDLSELNSSHTLTVLLTGSDKNVLEVGPATGYVTKLLRERGCRVTGIEIDAEAAAVAKQFCERLIVGNIETLDLADELGNKRFDVIALGDVLEHLADPLTVLRSLREYLAIGGYVVASIPNVAHGSIRLSLMEGAFDYSDVGLLDRTHLRFFTKASIQEMFLGAGYEIVEWRSTLKDPFETEQSVDVANYPSDLAEALRSDPEATAYQYVLKAIAASEVSPLTSTPERASQVLGALVRLRQLEVDLASERQRLAEARVRIVEQGSALSEREATLASIRQEPGYKLLTKVRRLLDRLAPLGSKRQAMLGLCQRALVYFFKPWTQGVLLKAPSAMAVVAACPPSCSTWRVTLSSCPFPGRAVPSMAAATCPDR